MLLNSSGACRSATPASRSALCHRWSCHRCLDLLVFLTRLPHLEILVVTILPTIADAEVLQIWEAQQELRDPTQYKLSVVPI
jgi:hypothetical protein